MFQYYDGGKLFKSLHIIKSTIGFFFWAGLLLIGSGLFNFSNRHLDNYSEWVG